MSGVFSTFYCQRSVSEAWTNPRPWSSGVFSSFFKICLFVLLTHWGGGNSLHPRFPHIKRPSTKKLQSSHSKDFVLHTVAGHQQCIFLTIDNYIGITVVVQSIRIHSLVIWYKDLIQYNENSLNSSATTRVIINDTAETKLVKFPLC